MKTCKYTCLVLAGLLAATSLFAGGGGEKSAQADDGLTAVRILGIDKEYTVNGKSLKLSDWYSGKVPSKLWDAFVAELARRGVKLDLDLIMADQIATTFQTTLATGKLDSYDMVSVNSTAASQTQMYDLYKRGRLYPLNKAIDEYSSGEARTYYNTDANGLFFKKMQTVEDGNFYWLTGSQENYYKTTDYPVSSSMTGMIRWDWLQALGLPMPSTVEEFRSDLLAFRDNDMNKNGVKDEVAEIAMDSFFTGIAQWYGLGVSLVTGTMDKNLQNQTVTSPWYQDHVKDYITFANQLYKDGLILVNSEGGDSQANRIGYTCDWTLETWLETGITTPDGAADAYYVPFILQALPDNSARSWIQAGRVVIWTPTFIPAKAKNVSAAVKLIDYLVTQDYSTLTERGILGYTFSFDNGVLKKFTTQDNPNGVGMDVEFVHADYPGIWANGSIMPRHAMSDAYEQVPKTRATPWPLKADFIERMYDKTWPFIMDLSSYLAFPTAAELERTTAISPDLNTYSTELLTSLIMGEKSLANWDSYIADLKRLGLDELIAINQARLNRAK